jgi:RecA/RadA recombinase
VRTSAIYELVGLPGSGRSFFAMSLSHQWVKTLQQSQVFYLDCEGSVDLESFSSVFERTEKSRVLFSRVSTEKQLFSFFKEFSRIVPSRSLVVIDSWNFLMKEVWTEQKSKPRLLLKLGMDLMKSVHQTDSALILVNGLNINSQVLFGESWGGIIDKRLFFSKVDSIFTVDLT